MDRLKVEAWNGEARLQGSNLLGREREHDGEVRKNVKNNWIGSCGKGKGWWRKAWIVISMEGDERQDGELKMKKRQK